MNKVLVTIGAVAGVLAAAMWALCAIGDALEGFEDPCSWIEEEAHVR